MQNNWPPTNPAIPVSPGALIANRFRLQKPLGSGSFGQVFLAEDLKFKPPRQVAIKFLHPQFLVDPQVREELEQEASTLARLKHPNILRVIDFEINENVAYIITDFAEGGSLAELLRPGPDKKPVQLPLGKISFYLEHLADALDYAHTQGLIHRDIKPLNVLLDSRGQPLLADFGLATPLANSQSSVLMNVNISGTPFYMAPEQWAGQAGKASDIYALAVMTYQMIAGQPPFIGNDTALGYQHINAPVPPLSERAPDLQYPSALDTVLAEALAKDPAKRTRPAMEFYRRFQAAMTSTAQRASAPTQKDPAYVATQVAKHQSPVIQTPQPQLPINKPVQPIAIPNTVVMTVPTKRKINRFLLPGLGIVGSIVFLAVLFLIATSSNSSSKNPVNAGNNVASQTPLTTLANTRTALPITTSSPTLVPTTLAIATSTPTLARTATPTPPQVSASLLKTLSGHTDRVNSVAWSPDGKTLASASGDQTVRLWSSNGQSIAILSGHTDRVNSVAWSPDGKILASASFDTTVRLWTASGQPITTLSSHTGRVFQIAWSPDGKILASASEAKTIRLWSANGQPIATLSGHTDSVTSVAWSPDSKTLASASFDNTIRLWAASGQPITTLSGHTASVFGVAWSPNGKIIASASIDKTIRLWSASGQPITTLSLSNDVFQLNSLVWSPDGNTLSFISANSGVFLWTANGQPITTLSGYPDVESVAWSPDSKILASTSEAKTIRLWTASGQPITTLSGYPNVESVAWSPDGKTLASGYINGSINLWGITGG